jgi:magnesium-transporting ATPase (P-type)
LLFRINISISVLCCSFILLLAHDFQLPPLALVVLVICLDLTVLAASKDKVFPDRKPSKWKMGELVTLSAVLGVLGALEGCAAYWLGESSSLVSKTNKQTKSIHLSLQFFSEGLTNEELAALVYLALSLGSQLSIFVCRTRSLFFSRRPGWSLFATVALGLVTACLISVFAVFEGFKGAIVKGNCHFFLFCFFSWTYELFTDCAAVLLICLCFFIIKDVVKVLILQAFKYREKSHQKHLRFFEENRKLLQDLGDRRMSV